MLLGPLRRKLTDVEVDRISEQLAGTAERGGEISTADVEKMISDTTLDSAASREEVARVSSRLAAAGRPLPTPPRRLRP